MCGSADDDATLLLCDGDDGRCEATAHTACVGLHAVPAGAWYCAKCDNVRMRAERERRAAARASATAPLPDGPPPAAPCDVCGKIEAARERSAMDAAAAVRRARTRDASRCRRRPRLRWRSTPPESRR